nr:MAG TPA: hypothetical protein [Caudoviricetes sp.]
MTVASGEVSKIPPIFYISRGRGQMKRALSLCSLSSEPRTWAAWSDSNAGRTRCRAWTLWRRKLRLSFHRVCMVAALGWPSCLRGRATSSSISSAHAP